MIFNKHKNQLEAEKQQELDRIRAEDRARHEEQLRREQELHREHENEEPKPKPKTGYKFFEPNPKPKELVSVLKNMFKKLFPETRKAYLLLTQYEDKKGYLLIVDIDAKFLKIINIYLDGETKMVRQGLPIECILYSKTGSLTDGIKPFYEKPVSEPPQIPPSPKAAHNDAGDNAVVQPDFPPMPEFLANHLSALDDIPGSEPARQPETAPQPKPTPHPEPTMQPEKVKQSAPQPEPHNVSVPKSELHTPEENKTAEPAKPEVKKITSDTSVKVVPETKQHLFALMNRAGSAKSGETMSIAKAGFGEFKFFIPYVADGIKDNNAKMIADKFPEDANSKIATVINRESGIKAVPFFTEEADAVKFAEINNYSLVKMKYKYYKKAIAADNISVPSVEGIIINPFSEQIVLPPDYPLL